MAKLKKIEVIAALKEKGIEFAEGTKYNDLYKLLKEAGPLQHSVPDGPAIDLHGSYPSTEEAPPPTKELRITNSIKKNNMFLADSVRNERDMAFLNAELQKRIHKGKIVKVTTVKNYVVIDGNWVTDFIIELKG